MFFGTTLKKSLFKKFIDIPCDFMKKERRKREQRKSLLPR